MQTLVIYRYSGSFPQICEMRQYVESIGLKPKLVIDQLELTLVGHSCGPLEALGWERFQLSLGRQQLTLPLLREQTTESIRAEVYKKDEVSKNQDKSKQTPYVTKKLATTEVKTTPKRTSRWSRSGKSTKSVWELDKQLKEKARADLKLDQVPLTKPMKVSASLVKEIEKHNSLTPAKSKKTGVWRQGTTYTITLHSRRPVCIHLDCICSNCREWNNPVYKYKDTSHGIVYLCHRCNEILRERSFGSRGGDAMYAAVGRNKAR